MQFLKFSVFSGADQLTPFQYLLNKYRNDDQKKQEAKQEKDKLLSNRKIQAKKVLDNALDKWRQPSQKAFKLCCLYEQEKLIRQKSSYKCQDKDISVALILGKLQDIDGVEYPPQLRRVASILCCLPVSSANVERIFSHLKLLYSKRRLRLNPEVVKQLMFLGQNACLATYTLRDFKKEKILSTCTS